MINFMDLLNLAATIFVWALGIGLVLCFIGAIGGAFTSDKYAKIREQREAKLKAFNADFDARFGTKDTSRSPDAQ